MDYLVPPLSAEMRRLNREIAYLEWQIEKVRQHCNLQRQCKCLSQPLLAHLLQLLPGGQWEVLTMFVIVIIVAMLNIRVHVRVRLEQATYARANNDLQDTKASWEADVSGLYNILTAMVDYRGHRMVAPGVSPGILQGAKSDSLLYGSVDNGKETFWNKDFHPMDTAKEADAQKCVSAVADQRAEIACGPNVFTEGKLAGGQEVTIVDRKDDLSSIKPFQTSGVLDLCPVVEHFVPVS